VLRVELTTQVLRIRTLLALAFLAAVPVAAAVSTAPHAGHRDGAQGGLFGASPYSALNHAMACLQFIGPLLLPLVVALLASAIGSADRDWGILRYLYAAPVSRRRLLAGKLAAVLVSVVVATVCVLVAGLLSGLVVFGWHPFHLIGAADLGTADALGRVLAASGYTVLCMLSIASIAFALGLALPHGLEALGASVAFVIAASILNAQSHLHWLAVILPTHYWQDWTALFAPGTPTHLGAGIIDQLATIAVAVAAAIVVLLNRDPAA
jgi:ABC-2 type transport system permease protein